MDEYPSIGYMAGGYEIVWISPNEDLMIAKTPNGKYTIRETSGKESSKGSNFATLDKAIKVAESLLTEY